MNGVTRMTENINQHVKEKYLDLLAEKFDAEEKVATGNHKFRIYNGITKRYRTLC